MTTRLLSLPVLAGLLGLSAAASHAAITYTKITSDADSGISTGNTYTHTLDFGTGTPGAVVNGVQFSAYNAGANGTLNFNRAVSTGTLNDHAGNANFTVTGGLTGLLTDMLYNGGNTPGGTTTWTLGGLTAGVTYDLRIYTRQWAAPSTRTVTFNFDPDGAGAVSESSININEDDATSVGMANANDAYYINYRYTAVAGQNLVITGTQEFNNNSWHLYGLSNQVVPVPEPAGAALSGLAALGLMLRRRR